MADDANNTPIDDNDSGATDPAAMPPPARVDLDELPDGWQRSAAARANGATWDLIERTDLSASESFDLLSRAYASAYHWRAATGPESIESARAAWLCSRAHVVVGDIEAAGRMADLCAALTDGAGEAASDFDLVYAVEARARAAAARGDDAIAVELRGEAVAATVSIDNEEDRSILEGDLAAPPWFGLADD